MIDRGPEIIPRRKKFYLGPVEFRLDGRRFEIGVGSVYRFIEFERLKFAFGLYQINDHFSLQLFGMFIHLFCTKRKLRGDILDSWAIASTDNALHLSWAFHRVSYRIRNRYSHLSTTRDVHQLPR